MAECPTCGDTFDTARGMRYHHAVVHDESIAKGREKTTLTCQNCGEEYEYRKDKAERSKYCSRECFDEGRGGWADREKRKCEVCDEIFETHPNDDQRFCSRDCFHDWRTDYMSGETSPLTNKVKRTCDECEQTFTRQESRVTQNERDYCSRECYHAKHTGEHAPNWKGGGVSYYGPTWRSQRRQTLKRDDHECQDCGLTRDEHYEEYGRDLEVHHKEPIRNFSDKTAANQLSNLITLCTSCHIEREHSDE